MCWGLWSEGSDARPHIVLAKDAGSGPKPGVADKPPGTLAPKDLVPSSELGRHLHSHVHIPTYRHTCM